MLPALTPTSFLTKNQAQVQRLVDFVNRQQKVHKVVIESLTGQGYPLKAYRFEDVLRMVEQGGLNALFAPLDRLEQQQQHVLQTIDAIAAMARAELDMNPPGEDEPATACSQGACDPADVHEADCSLAPTADVVVVHDGGKTGKPAQGSV